MAGWKISFSSPIGRVWGPSRQAPPLSKLIFPPSFHNGQSISFFLCLSISLFLSLFVPLFLFFCASLSASLARSLTLSLSVFLAYLAEDRLTPACLAFLNPSLCLHSTLLLRETAWIPPLMTLALFLVPHPNPQPWIISVSTGGLSPWLFSPLNAFHK